MTIPIKEYVAMYGTVAGRQVTILKDYEYNTNVMSKTFVHMHNGLFRIYRANMKINLSGKSFTEITGEVVVSEMVQKEDYTYKSNLIVSNCSYDILLGMPWNVEHELRRNYKSGKLIVSEKMLPTAVKSSNARVKIQNLGARKFRSLFQKTYEDNDFAVFQDRLMNNLATRYLSIRHFCDREEAKIRKNQFKDLLKDASPDRLPPKQDVYHNTATFPNDEHPRKGIFQL